MIDEMNASRQIQHVVLLPSRDLKHVRWQRDDDSQNKLLQINY